MALCIIHVTPSFVLLLFLVLVQRFFTLTRENGTSHLTAIQNNKIAVEVFPVQAMKAYRGGEV